MIPIIDLFRKIKIIHLVLIVVLIAWGNSCIKQNKHASTLMDNIENMKDSLVTVIKNNKASVVVSPNVWTKQEAEAYLNPRLEEIKKSFGIKQVSTGVSVSGSSSITGGASIKLVPYEDVKRLFEQSTFFDEFGEISPGDSVITWDYKLGFFDVKGSLVGGGIIQSLRYNLYMDIFKGVQRRWDKEGFWNKINIFEKRDPKIVYQSPDTCLKFDHVEYNEIK